MARPEAVALGGFVPVQEDLRRAIASLVQFTRGCERSGCEKEKTYYVADPCAGDGEGIFSLAKHWVLNGVKESGQPLQDPSRPEQWDDHIRFFLCEMELKRAMKLIAQAKRFVYWNVAHQGDAFLIDNDPDDDGVDVLWHNPPYDFDRNAFTNDNRKRLEERWLARFGPLVAEDGVLLHYVPYYALGASAETIGRHFQQVTCYRVPKPFWEEYHQVVLVGRRRSTLAFPDPGVVRLVEMWSKDPSTIPELPIRGFADAPYKVAWTHKRAPRWEMGSLDSAALLDRYVPWMMSTRAGKLIPIPNVEPERPYTDLMAPRVRLGCDPRPAHIALAAGAGVLSGVELVPDAGQSGPSVLLKGVHRRTYKHLRFRERDGKCVGEERQHHPELHMSVLRLDTGEFRTLSPTTTPSGSEHFEQWTVGDLLARYSQSMLAAFRERCELIYDSRTKNAGPAKFERLSNEPLYAAQEDAVRASLRLLQEKDRSVLLLGEIGVGKTRIALTTAWYQLGGKGRVLVIVPPTLIDEWKSEIRKTITAARVHVVRTVEDIEMVAALPSDAFHVILLTKEDAKLGHAWEGVTVCPKCGHHQTKTKEEAAERRARCERVIVEPINESAEIALRLAEGFATACPNAQLWGVVQTTGGRIVRRARQSTSSSWRDRLYLLKGLARQVRHLIYRSDYRIRTKTVSAWYSFLHAVGEEKFIYDEAMALFRSTLSARKEAPQDLAELHRIAIQALLLLPPFSPWFHTAITEISGYRTLDHWNKSVPFCSSWRTVVSANKALRSGILDLKTFQLQEFSLTPEGEPTYGKRPWRSDAAFNFFIEIITGMAVWTKESTCGERLFQAIGRPAKVPLSQYIIKRHPNLFDFLILEEAQHYGTNANSAQSKAAQQLLSVRLRKRIPTMALTGTVMNGYAKSLFVVMWYLSSAFREEFDQNQSGEFERRYGFLVQVLEMVDEKKQVVVYGTHSDRVTVRARTAHSAPGVLPFAVLRFLLPNAVTIQLSDLEINLPPCIEKLVGSVPNKDQRKRGQAMEDAILDKIASDRFKEGRVGRLFGALAHQPRYYDHATSDTGNRPDGSWTVAYPEDASVSENERLVARWPGLSPELLLPKEEDLLSFLRERLAQGRNAVVAVSRVTLAQRLVRILGAELGVKIVYLDTKKVSARARRSWIEAQKDKGVRILVTSPAAIPEGLNVLVGYFTAVAMFDDPNNNPTILRQFRGRFVRIGMTGLVDFWTFVYKKTTQEYANDLLQQKRIIATATDGLDASSAFEVAGVGESVVFESDLSKVLHTKMLEERARTHEVEARGG